MTGVCHTWKSTSKLMCGVFILVKSYLFLYSLGFSLFSPRGARLRNRRFQFLSTLFLMETACSLWGGLLMNSRTLIIMSSAPWWPAFEKCLPIDFSCLVCLMTPKWPENLSLILNSVWPTYCSLHRLQVIEYMRLELLHEFLMLWDIWLHFEDISVVFGIFEYYKLDGLDIVMLVCSLYFFICVKHFCVVLLWKIYLQM